MLPFNRQPNGIYPSDRCQALAQYPVLRRQLAAFICCQLPNRETCPEAGQPAIPGGVTVRFAVLVWCSKGQAGAGSLFRGVVIEATISLMMSGFLLLEPALSRACLGGIHLADRWIHCSLWLSADQLDQKTVPDIVWSSAN